MRRSRSTEEQIIDIPPNRAALSDLCRKHGVGDASIYEWKAEFGGMDASAAKRLRALGDENAERKRMLADAMLDDVELKDLARERSGDARREAERRRPSRGRPRDERTAGV